MAYRPLKDTLSGHEGKGLMKVVVNAHNDKVVGIHLVGAEVAEILQVLLPQAAGISCYLQPKLPVVCRVSDATY